MAEKLKPIEGYTITTLPYGETFYLCDTCGMAVAPEPRSPSWSTGRSRARLCDTCGRWVTGWSCEPANAPDEGPCPDCSGAHEDRCCSARTKTDDASPAGAASIEINGVPGYWVPLPEADQLAARTLVTKRAAAKKATRLSCAAGPHPGHCSVCSGPLPLVW